MTFRVAVHVLPRRGILDPQGKAVCDALPSLGFAQVAGVHVGKYIEIDLAPGTDREAARQALDTACHRFPSNPVIEDYKLEIAD